MHALRCSSFQWSPEGPSHLKSAQACFYRLPARPKAFPNVGIIRGTDIPTGCVKPTPFGEGVARCWAAPSCNWTRWAALHLARPSSGCSPCKAQSQARARIARRKICWTAFPGTCSPAPTTDVMQGPGALREPGRRQRLIVVAAWAEFIGPAAHGSPVEGTCLLGEAYLAAVLVYPDGCDAARPFGVQLHKQLAWHVVQWDVVEVDVLVQWSSRARTMSVAQPWGGSRQARRSPGTCRSVPW